jgi:hypothetical protein
MPRRKAQYIGLTLAVLKKQLVVRNAWEIPLDDFDSMAVLPEDDPFIPPDVKDAAVTTRLAEQRRRKS